jgi:hypothetical protein
MIAQYKNNEAQYKKNDIQLYKRSVEITFLAKLTRKERRIKESIFLIICGALLISATLQLE